MARPDQAPPHAAGSQAKVVIMGLMALGFLAIVGLGAYLKFMPKKEPTVVRVNPRGKINGLNLDAKRLHKAKSYEAAIKKYAEVAEYVNGLRREPKYQGPDYSYLDEIAAQAEVNVKRVREDRVDASGGGAMADTREERDKIVAEARKHYVKPTYDAAFYLGQAKEEHQRAKEFFEEARQRGNVNILQQAADSARESVRAFENMKTHYPDDAAKHAADAKASRDLLARIESAIRKKKP